MADGLTTVIAMLSRLEERLEREGVLRGNGRAAALLDAIADHYSGSHFTARDLISFAVADERPDLGAALGAMLGDGWQNPRRLGKALAGIEGQALAGYVVERTGTESAGERWMIRLA